MDHSHQKCLIYVKQIFTKSGFLTSVTRFFCENAFTKNVALYRESFYVKNSPGIFYTEVRHERKNKAWLCLLCAGLSEVIWAYTMKLSCGSDEIYVYKDGKVY